MPKVVFKFDKEQDLFNNWHKATHNGMYGQTWDIPSDIIKICKGKKFEEAKDRLAKVLSSAHNSPLIKICVESVEKSWRLVEKEYFKRMDKLMKHKFSKNITAYLTTLQTCPYNPKEPSFMFSMFTSIPGNTHICGHEIMHLYFHEFYWNEAEKEIGYDKTSDLKEALTVLLNLEFRDLWIARDTGYPNHADLRRFISTEWKNKKDFPLLLKKCIKYLQKK